MFHKNCDGCLANLTDDLACSFVSDNYNGDCPCTICIVKVTCQNYCEEHDKWVEKILDNDWVDNDVTKSK